MNQPRFAQDTSNSFFGHFLYEPLIPKNHFVRQARKLIDWHRFTNLCMKWYQGKGQVGRPPYEPAKMLRMLFASYLYNISERQTEEMVKFNMLWKYFVGLGMDEEAPDHSSLTKFKNRLIARGGQKAYDRLLKEILVQASGLGIKFGQIQVIDSVHTLANVDTDKEEQRQKEGQPPRDPQARWGVKKEKKIRDENGQERKVPQYFYGYKSHLSLNAQNRLITAVKTTSGNKYDGQQMKTLINKDEKLKKVLPPKRIYTADKGYDDGDNHTYLKEKNLGDALCLNDYRTKKKNQNKEPWLKLKQSKAYQEAQKERYKIEQTNAINKNGHGLRRCRYLGAKRFNLQAQLTAITYNLMVVVAFITGSTLKGYPFNNRAIRLAT